MDKIAKELSLPGGAHTSNVASGLKQALEIGTANTVTKTGTTNEYFGTRPSTFSCPKNCASWKRIDPRMAGQGPKLDEFEFSLNRAAEKASPAARHAFKRAISETSFDDARGTLQGSHTGATDCFKN